MHLFFRSFGEIMSKLKKPFVIARRNDAKTFYFTLNSTSGLSERICREWQRVSFQNLPNALAQYRNPKNKTMAEAGVYALIQYLKQEQETNDTKRIPTEDITVKAWIERSLL